MSAKSKTIQTQIENPQRLPRQFLLPLQRPRPDPVADHGVFRKHRVRIIPPTVMRARVHPERRVAGVGVSGRAAAGRSAVLEHFFFLLRVVEELLYSNLS